MHSLKRACSRAGHFWLLGLAIDRQCAVPRQYWRLAHNTKPRGTLCVEMCNPFLTSSILNYSTKLAYIGIR